jgi:hypothetical protein
LAANTAASLRLVADHHKHLTAELARLLSVEQLEVETARLLVGYARQIAQHRHQAGEDPPDGDDAFDRVVRGAMALIQDEESERADKALAALMRHP